MFVSGVPTFALKVYFPFENIGNLGNLTSLNTGGFGVATQLTLDLQQPENPTTWPQRSTIRRRGVTSILSWLSFFSALEEFTVIGRVELPPGMLEDFGRSVIKQNPNVQRIVIAGKEYVRERIKVRFTKCAICC
jgi:hypothetical protein